MRDAPTDLTGALVTELLRRHWGVEPVEVRYAPVGFGSYHSVAADRDRQRWFVTADYLSSGGSWLGPDAETVSAALTAAAQTTRALANQGYEFALAPVADRNGVLIRRVLPRWMMQVFPFQDGWSTDDGAWGEQAEPVRTAGSKYVRTEPLGTHPTRSASGHRAGVLGLCA